MGLGFSTENGHKIIQTPKRRGLPQPIAVDQHVRTRDKLLDTQPYYGINRAPSQADVKRMAKRIVDAAQFIANEYEIDSHEGKGSVLNPRSWRYQLKKKFGQYAKMQDDYWFEQFSRVDPTLKIQAGQWYTTESVVHNIFSRLPLDVLGPLKVVCLSWFEFLSSRSFLLQQLDEGPAVYVSTPKFSPSNLSTQSTLGFFEGLVVECSHVFVDDNERSTSFRVINPSINPPNGVKLDLPDGPHGMVCMGGRLVLEPELGLCFVLVEYADDNSEVCSQEVQRRSFEFMRVDGARKWVTMKNVGSCVTICGGDLICIHGESPQEGEFNVSAVSPWSEGFKVITYNCSAFANNDSFRGVRWGDKEFALVGLIGHQTLVILKLVKHAGEYQWGELETLQLSTLSNAPVNLKIDLQGGRAEFDCGTHVVAFNLNSLQAEPTQEVERMLEYRSSTKTLPGMVRNTEPFKGLESVCVQLVL